MSEIDLVLNLGVDAEAEENQIVIEYGQTEIDNPRNLIPLRNTPSLSKHTSFRAPVIDLTTKLGLGDDKSLASSQRTNGVVHNTVIDLTMDSDEEDEVQIVKHKKSQKGHVFRKKMWKYTKAELEAVPAVVFPKFGALPQELQDIIWTFALTQPTIIECIYRSDLQQFWAHGSKSSVLECSPLKSKNFNLQPIYLRPCIGQQRVLPKTKKNSPQGLTVDPIYICPGDIVYLPEIYSMDVGHFIKEEKNKVIENLAIHASSALRLNLAGQVWSHPTQEGMVIGGLPNLKSIHVVDGVNLGSEMSSKHLGNYRLTLTEVMKGEERGTTNSKNVFKRKAKHAWNSGVADSTRKIFMKEILNERKRRRLTGERNWQQPKLFFHALKRELIAMSHLG